MKTSGRLLVWFISSGEEPSQNLINRLQERVIAHVSQEDGPHHGPGPVLIVVERSSLFKDTSVIIYGWPELNLLMEEQLERLPPDFRERTKAAWLSLDNDQPTQSE